jgi:peptidoglycan/xylan/chitin deacetylase (PgdA/CDA1 family)
MPRLTLTFDNGPTPGVTEQVFEALEHRSLLATFFVIGQKAATPEGSALVDEARARGHWVGNHTMSHGEPLGLLDDPVRELGEIADAQAVLGARAEPKRLFRPTGHGTIGPHLLTPASYDYLATEGFTMALWSLFVRDSKMPEGWADRALGRLPERDWHVLVVHDLPTGAMDDLPYFLDAAADRGIDFVQDFPPYCTPLLGGQPVDHFEDAYVTNALQA